LKAASRALSRRAATLGSIALMAATSRGAGAQTATPRHYALMSLIGDKFTVVVRGELTGSRLDRNPQTEIALNSDVFDRAALGVANDLIRRADPRANPTSLLLDEPALYEQQAKLFDGKFVRLPTAIVKVARDAGATHMLLITKHRATASFKLVEATVGQGTLSGLGFYVEPDMRVHNINSNDSTTGFLGLYAVYRATVVDLATEAIVAERMATHTNLYTTTGAHAEGGHPWQALDAKAKVKVVADMLMRSLREELPPLLAQQ
jgi:hypothetical protein